MRLLAGHRLPAAGMKLPVVIAAALTEMEYFGDWAERTDWAAEDRQVFIVTQDDLDRNHAAYDSSDPRYLSSDFLGQPEYHIQPQSPRTSSLNARLDAAYRVTNYRHYVGQALACMAVSGARAIWNNEAFFQYADRVMDQPFFPDSAGNVGDARTHGTNAPTDHVQQIWDAERAALGNVWEWPE